MQIELTEREVRRIVPILKEEYQKSFNLWEIADLKGILEKLGEKVDDWTPHYREMIE